MFDQFIRNHIDLQCTTSGTSWQMLGANGVGYSSYVNLLAGSTVQAPGSPSQFATGVPRVIIQCLASDGTPSADSLSIATNRMIAPTVPDVVIPGGDVLVLDQSATTSLWFMKETSGDLVNVSFQF